VDRALVVAARNGDRDAFGSLVHEVDRSLFSVAFRILRDRGLAEDALSVTPASSVAATEPLPP
jgi:DNA-directed RNA polymerase specialized sigma24 family protein